MSDTPHTLREKIRRTFRGRTHKSTRKLTVITEKDQLKYRTIVAPYEPTVDKLTALFEEGTNKARIDELEKFKEHSYNLGFRGSGMEHLDARLKALKPKNGGNDERN